MVQKNGKTFTRNDKADPRSETSGNKKKPHLPDQRHFRIMKGIGFEGDFGHQIVVIDRPVLDKRINTVNCKLFEGKLCYLKVGVEIVFASKEYS